MGRISFARECSAQPFSAKFASKLEREGSYAALNYSYRAAAVADRLTANLRVQCRLGLLSERWDWPAACHCHHPGAYG